jgi:hypothetical protein
MAFSVKVTVGSHYTIGTDQDQQWDNGGGVNDLPILGHDDAQNLVKEFSAQYDAPAYVRRARELQHAHEALVERCRKQRTQWLEMVRIRVGQLFALAGDGEALRSLLRTDAEVEILRRLHADLQPRLRTPIKPTTSPRALRRALTALLESIERFNRRWCDYLPTVDLGEVNRLREGYNRYYLLEKECAMRSSRLAGVGFRKLEPLTTQHLCDELPPLPLPVLAG